MRPAVMADLTSGVSDPARGLGIGLQGMPWNEEACRHAILAQQLQYARYRDHAELAAGNRRGACESTRDEAGHRIEVERDADEKSFAGHSLVLYRGLRDASRACFRRKRL